MAEERAQRRLAAILAADVVGYSRLMGVSEAGTLASLKTHRRELIDGTIAEHQGRIVKLIGDGVLVEFPSVVNAVACAVEIQRRMIERNAHVPQDRRIEFRIGVNLGDIIFEDNDIFGDGVNVAARIESIAKPGGVCVSGSVRDNVGNRLDLTFEDMGEQTLKNIDRPVRVYNVSLGAIPRSPRPAPQPAAKDKPSIAVLPFTNMSGDPEQQYFSDGITEDIITELSRYHSLLVIARNSCFQFRGSSVDIAAVQRALGARYIVEGSVRKAGNRVRVTAQLIDAETRAHLWAERYDRDIQDIFAVQDEVTRTVVATVEGRVAASGAEHARRKPTRDWVAYDYFLKGREHVNRYQDTEAEPFLARAIELDPDYVHAHAWRAVALSSRYLLDDRKETLDAAFASAQRALALDENDAWAHRAMGCVALRRHQLDIAGLHYDRAIGLNPNDVNIACDRANWLTYVRKYDEALRSLDSARQLDPYPPTWVWEVRGQALFCLKRYDEAITAFRSVGTQHFWIPGFLAAAYAHLGQLDDAHRELANYLEARPDMTLTSLASILYVTEEMRDGLLGGLRKAGLPE